MDYKNSNIGNFFGVAMIGSLICLFSGVIDIIMAVQESDDLAKYSDLCLTLGAAVWAIGLIGAGNVLCENGHKETGVVTAGGALMFWSFAQVLYMIFVDPDDYDFKSVSFYLWEAFLLLGPVIFYLALKQEKDHEDKFLGAASMGMGFTIICNLIIIGILLLEMWVAEGNGVEVRSAGGYVVVAESRGVVIAEWIAENYKVVSIIISSIYSFGLLMCFFSMVMYKDFLEELDEERDLEEKAQLIEDILEDYNQRNKQY